MEKDTVTMIGAGVAAVASTITLFHQVLDRWDRYVLRWGGIDHDEQLQGCQFYAVNTGKHNVSMLDYGFVYESGYFVSIAATAHSQWEEDGDHSCNLIIGPLEPHRPQQAGGILGKFDAAYAISATEIWPSIAFRPGVPLWRRLRLLACVMISRDSLRRRKLIYPTQHP